MKGSQTARANQTQHEENAIADLAFYLTGKERVCTLLSQIGESRDQ
jgi:hypothetical protein